MTSELDDAFIYDPLEFYDDPYPVYTYLRDIAPVYRNEARDVWVLSRYDDVRSAARDWTRFVSGRGVDTDTEDYSLGPGDFLDLDPPHHDELRRVIHGAFTPKRIHDLESLVRERVLELL